MIRWIWRAAALPERILSEDGFIAEVLALERVRFANAPGGAVTIEALDERGRVCWRGYYASAQELAALARQLKKEREL
jgi:hypothetical protein